MVIFFDWIFYKIGNKKKWFIIDLIINIRKIILKVFRLKRKLNYKWDFRKIKKFKIVYYKIDVIY